MRARPALLVSILILLFGASEALHAQTERATLEGTITDQSGAIVAGAVVTATNGDTGIAVSGKTNTHGYYIFPGLAVGNYTVDVSDAGFQAKDLQNVVLVVGETHTLDVRLSVGAVSEKVVVSAQAEPAERTSAAAAGVITANQITNLPPKRPGLGELHAACAVRAG